MPVDRKDDTKNVAGLGALLSLPVVPASEFTDWTPDRTSRSSIRPRGSAVPSPSTASDRLDPAEVRFLRAVIDHPGTPSSALPKLARVSARRGLEIRDRLVSLGYLRVHHVATAGRGRTSLVLEPLEPAHHALAAEEGR